jgi:hypothetical protein
MTLINFLLGIQPSIPSIDWRFSRAKKSFLRVVNMHVFWAVVADEPRDSYPRRVISPIRQIL